MTRTDIRALSKKLLTRKSLFALSAFVLIGTLIVVSGLNLPVTKVVTIFTEDGHFEFATSKTLVADILAEAEITLDANTERTIPALDEELEANYIVIEKAANVVIAVDGQELAVYSWAKTIEELLAEQNIVLDGDIVNLPLGIGITTGQKIEIVRVTSELAYEEVAIAAKTTIKNDSSLASGRQTVQTKPQDGKKKITYEVILHDGVEVSREIVAEEVIAEPVTGVTLRGTMAMASRSSATPTGTYSAQGEASWYGSKFHGNKTASGAIYDMYAFTAAHRTLAFGTKVKVTYLKTGKSVVVTINDRGPHVANRIIDLSAAAAKEIGLQSAGVGMVRIEAVK